MCIRDRPILVGTVSIEKSETISKMLKKKGIKHEVLNAKHHEKEAHIIAQAGKLGAVTIATNMAGRGTDIILGGNAETMAKIEMKKLGFSDELINESTSHAETEDKEIIKARETFSKLNKEHNEEVDEEAKKVKKAGGLYIMGTERHESRRIDNQLRGRAGRQGDPGMSRFYLSADDDLLRLFGGERMKSLMDRLNVEENMPIENKMLTNTIESAQRKVEGRNFGIRKNVLQYDDVLNRQREIIYSQRDQVLNNEDLKEQIEKMMDQAIDDAVALYLPKGALKEDWNFEGLIEYFRGWLLEGHEFKMTTAELERLEPEFISKEIKEKAMDLYKKREEEFGDELMREVERVILLKNVDNKWMDHIDAMEELKQGIRLRAYGQRNPVVEYRMEGFDMFDEMIASIREDTIKMMLTLKLKKQDEAPKREQVASDSEMKASSDGTDTVNKTVIKGKKVGRNDLCPCGSGKKYKKCCGKDS
eukprot:TRINITY_DN215_c0_g1_i12.p1 TRINITY_DN215_c0_g1~~TRINITY_DN215_c0_g1_i12.p1  ORF type:complete len:476 (+),score=13.96 TRINITY_DN215_c0_g1_i12:77-1504(+)